MAAADYIQVAQQLYLAYFGRPADRNGLINMTNALAASGAPQDANGIAEAYLHKTNATVVAILDSFGASAESKALYGTGSDAKFIATVYQQVLNRAPDLEGLDYWTNALATGALTRANAATQIIAAALKDGGDATDALTVTNKITVATNFTAAIDTAAEVIGYDGDVAAAQARDLLQNVTSATDPTAYQATVDSVLDQLANPPVPVNNINLTTNADNIIGTTGADVFNATLPLSTAGGADAAATLTPGDVITGGAGVDTLAITVSGTNTGGAGSVNPTLRSTEKVLVANLAGTGSQGVTIDLTLADSAVNTIGTSASTTDNVTTNFTNVGSLVAVEQAGRGDLSVTFAAGVASGNADSLTLTLKTVGDATAGQFTTSGIETLNLVSTGSNNDVTVVDTALKTLKISGATDVSVGFGAGTAPTVIDATAATGTVTVDGTGLVLANTTVKGGAGSADEFVTDTATITNTTLANVSGFEVLGLSGANATATLNAAVAGVSTFDLRTGSANHQTLTLNTGYTGATTVNVDSGDTVVNNANVALTVSGSVSNFNNTTVTGGTGTDTIRMSANGTSAALAGLTAIETITVSANASDATLGATLTGLTTASGKTVTVDASALGADAALSFTAGADAGHLSIVGGAGADTIVLGNGGDTVNAGAGNDTITAGTGADSINAGAGNDTIIMNGNLTSADTIDGGAGNDTLVVDSVGTNAFANVTNIENVKFSANATSVSLSAPLTTSTVTLDLTDAAVQSLTLAAGYTGATTVKVGTGDTITNTANVALTVTGAAAMFNNTNIAGGTGTDVVSLTADGTTATVSGLTNVETITVNASTTLGQGVTLSGITGVAAGKVETINASALTDTTAAFGLNTVTAAANSGLNIIGAAGVNTINWSGSAANVTLVGGASADVITAGTGIDSINAGAGNDIINMGTNLTFDDTIDGGAGTDTLVYSGTGTIGAAGEFAHVTNVEVLQLTGNGGSVTIGSSTPAFTTFDLSNTQAQTVTINPGFTSAVTVKVTGNGSATGDTIVNTGNVALTVNGKVADIALATITGGTGVDTLNLASDNTGATLTSVTNVEQINVTGSAIAGLTLVAGNVASGKTLTVDASAITSANGSLVLNGTAIAATGSLIVTGSAGNDNILTGAGADTIVAGAGNDFINSGAGLDVITTGAGNDVVVVNTNSNKLTFATVTDFSAGDALQFATVGTASTTVAAKLTLNSAATLSDYIDAAAAGNGSGNSLLNWFQFGGNTYVVADSSNATGFAAGTDKIIQLNGLVDLSNSVISATSGTATWQLGTGAALSGFTLVDTGSSSLTGSALSDTFVMGATFTSADSISGGLGNDIIKASGTIADSAFTNVTSVETLNLTDAATVTLGTNANTAGISSVVVSGTAAVSVNASAAASVHSITGGTGADTLIGNATASTIVGGGGADTITGGAGADSITVSGTTSVIKYTSATLGAGDLLVNVVDSITGFAVGDTIDLSAVEGSLIASGGSAGAGGAIAAAASASLFTNGATGAIEFIDNGTDTFLVISQANDTNYTTGADITIKLVGVHGHTFNLSAAGIVTMA